MNAQPSALASPLAGPCAEPISLETLAVAEQVLLQMLRDWRERLQAPVAPDAGAVEYESWMRGARH